MNDTTFQGTGMVIKVPVIVGKPKKQTKADTIRSMTDGELADFLCHIVSNKTVNCAHCVAEDCCKMGRNGFIDWLKQEVDT